ncbi:hypothetical protein D3C71_1654720 [compost metagenome]
MWHVGLPFDVHGQGNSVQHALGCVYGLAGRTFGQQQHELIARQPANQIACPQALCEALGHLAQHRVARAMPLGVVDLFESIQVDKQQGRGAGALLQIGKRQFCTGVEHGAIGQAGEGVKKCQLVDALMGSVPLDGQRTQVQAHIYQALVQGVWRARLAVVEREGADRLPVVIADRAGPARP